MILKAMVVERNDFWFMDDGALTYHICEVKTKIRDKKKKKNIWGKNRWINGRKHMKDKKDKQKYKELIRKDDSPMATPPVVEPCTACDEAKYEVRFSNFDDFISTQIISFH